MAVDEAILEAVGRDEALPTLRLYAWDPPCLSLGYAQPLADADLSRLAAKGWDLVRRPTGGRAILHTDELTYSVIGPADEPRLKGDVLESYQRLSRALLAALQLLGLPAQAHPLTPQKQDGNVKGPVCFEVPSNYEITVDGRKLVGSAQARKRQGVLQHGTLPLWGDLTRITQGLCFEDEQKRGTAASRLLTRATTVEGVLGKRISWEEAALAFSAAFEKELALKLETSVLSPIESRRAEELVREKYGNPEWIQRL
jgi:lipoate-protein ligase A